MSKLTKQEINDSLRKWQAEGCIESRNRVVEANLKMCYHIARRISLPQDVEDVAHSAAEGLIKACDSFDPEKGEWSSHAYQKARAYAWNYKIADRPVRIGKEAQIAKYKQGESPVEMVALDEEAQTKDFTIDLLNSEHNEKVVEAALLSISQKQRDAIRSVYIYGMTEREYGDSQGVSHQAISDRIHKGMKKIRELMT